MGVKLWSGSDVPHETSAITLSVKLNELWTIECFFKSPGIIAVFVLDYPWWNSTLLSVPSLHLRLSASSFLFRKNKPLVVPAFWKRVKWCDRPVIRRDQRANWFIRCFRVVSNTHPGLLITNLCSHVVNQSNSSLDAFFYLHHSMSQACRCPVGCGILGSSRNPASWS